jgi:hypothetical protein
MNVIALKDIPAFRAEHTPKGAIREVFLYVRGAQREEYVLVRSNNNMAVEMEEEDLVLYQKEGFEVDPIAYLDKCWLRIDNADGDQDVDFINIHCNEQAANMLLNDAEFIK